MRRTKRLPLEELAPYLWEAKGPLAWHQVFGNNRPVEIEVGFGKGLFLLTAAQQRPDVNFFGVEIMRKYQLFTATRMAVRQLTNVRLACADARQFLKEYVPPVSVRAIHVYFPDPWWKKRHHKRRVFTADFVDSCVKALRPGGEFYLATDVPEYLAVMTELCNQRPELEPLPPPALGEQDYLTNFERKAKLKGQPVDRALYWKKSSGGIATNG